MQGIQGRVESEWTTKVVSMRREGDRAAAKGYGRELAHLAGLDARRIAALDLVIHELATNLLEHAERGELWLRTVAGQKVEVAAIDAGPGIQRLERVMARPSLTGLVNVRRLAQEFEVDSTPGAGTTVRAVIGPEVRAAALA